MRGLFTKDYWIIKWSGLFDPVYYLKQYPDVRQADVDPLEHFVLHGWKEGRNPNEWFNTREYLEKNPDVAQAGINPFVHWIRWYKKEYPIKYNNSLITKSIKVLKEEGFSSFLRKSIKKLGIKLKIFRSNFLRQYRVMIYKKTFKNKIEELSSLTSLLNHQENLLKIVACTIVSKNYLHFALTLMESFKKFHPHYDFKILLCDLWEDKEDLDIFLKLSNTIIPIYKLTTILDIPKLEEMLFKYNVLEMNTAIKPFFLEYLLRLGYDKVIYFDPDILILDNLDDMINLLNSYNIILTPHILSSIPDDGKKPIDLDILKFGIYNLGFIGIKNSEETIRFLKWWQEKLIDYCFMDVKNGLHVDQKWIDFVPIFFEKVCILKEKAYNVAYWNLHERNVELKNSKFFVNGTPIKFFHFSGFTLYDINNISKHQDRYKLKDFPELKELFKLYKDKLLANGYDFFSYREYYFDKFPSTNIKITNEIRSLYNVIFEKDLNPFNVQHIENVVELINQEVYPNVSRLAVAIYTSRLDLQKAFPNIESNTKSRDAFINWLVTQGIKEHNIHNVFIVRKFNLENNLVRDKIGVCLYGYHSYSFGVADSLRALRETILSSGIPFTLFNIETEAHTKVPDELQKYYSTISPYKLNIIHVNADQLPHVYRCIGKKCFETKYNVGVWYWELEDNFPFDKSFELIDELWAFSDFLYRIYSTRTTKPVVKMYYPFSLNCKYILSSQFVREKYKLAEDDVVFYFSFDFLSCIERKNPDGVIKAFMMAFDNPVKYKNVKLIVKSINGKHAPNYIKYLKELSKNDERVIYLDIMLNKEEQVSLINASDCFISLHRSEGLGLGILEAMYLGKCVIATNYGGNVGYTTTSNSLLVDYKLTEVSKDWGPYKRGSKWAEPNLEQAVEYMRWVYYNIEKARELGKKASEDIKEICNKGKLDVIQRIKHIFESI